MNFGGVGHKQCGNDKGLAFYDAAAAAAEKQTVCCKFFKKLILEVNQKCLLYSQPRSTLSAFNSSVMTMNKRWSLHLPPKALKSSTLKLLVKNTFLC